MPFRPCHILGILLLATTLAAQEYIRGVVRDAQSGEVIPGANIELVGTQTGTVTDQNGDFSLRIPGGIPGTLKVTHIAYKPLEMTVSDKLKLDLQLVPSVITGEEVSVFGTPSKYQLDVATTVDLLDLETMQRQGSRDLEGALRRVSGIRIQAASSGKQTASIRGSNASDVAVYLDGMRVNDSNTGVADLSLVDLNVLEQVQVIKSGNTALFGQGAIGGVVNLESRQAHNNSFTMSQGVGRVYDHDIDLSLGGTARLGWFGAGAYYSGKTRAYGGRTLTSSVFKTVFTNLSLPGGVVTARWNQLSKTLTFPSGSVDAADGLDLISVHYRGRLLHSGDWEFYAGLRQWHLDQDFFTSLQEQLRDGAGVLRVAKLLKVGNFENTLQMESEEQYFRGQKTYLSVDGLNLVHYKGEIGRRDQALALASRYVVANEHPAVDRLCFEVGLRLDRTATWLDEWFEFPDILLDGNPLSYVTPGFAHTATVTGKRIGFQAEGRLPNFRYQAFVNQGTNQRLPSLSDHFRFVSTSGDSLTPLPLTPEHLGTTTASLTMVLDDISENLPHSELELNLDVFINDYTNKITYRNLADRPPLPYNFHTADIRGLEGRLALYLWTRRLMLAVNGIRIKLSNPIVFPYNPEYRLILLGEMNLDWLALSYDYFQEGKQYYSISGVGSGFHEPRYNANLNVVLSRKFLGLKWSLAYTVRNLLSRSGRDLPLEESLRRGFNYFEKYRDIVTLKVEL